MIEFLSDKPEGNFSSSSYSGIKLNEFTDTLIKNLLFKVYRKELEVSQLRVEKILAINSGTVPIPRTIIANYNKNNNCFHFQDATIIVSVIYNRQSYEICFIITTENYRSDTEYVYTMHIIGLSGKACESIELGKFIFNTSLTNSNFRNKTVSYSLLENEDTFYHSALNIMSTADTKLHDIFIPESKKEQIERFIYAVENYHRDHINLRYLLNGIPGTGKTQVINSIINSLEGKVTIVLTQGGNFPIKEIIEFCSLYAVCLLVIDDIDFVIRNREDTWSKESLGTFLQYLDGFIPSNIFLLASTNDKRLVDNAASRPGRFDLILDINEINSSNYLSLIKRETSDQEIISLFTDDFLETLRVNKITGAYLVNLIKQLKSVKQMKGIVTQSDFNNYFTITHDGFYKSNADEYQIALGF